MRRVARRIGGHLDIALRPYTRVDLRNGQTIKRLSTSVAEWTLCIHAKTSHARISRRDRDRDRDRNGNGRRVICKEVVPPVP